MNHFKEHIIIRDGDEYKVCSVPAGQGNIHLPQECSEELMEKQIKGVEQSVQYAIKLRDKYCR